MTFTVRHALPSMRKHQEPALNAFMKAWSVSSGLILGIWSTQHLETEPRCLGSGMTAGGRRDFLGELPLYWFSLIHLRNWVLWNWRVCTELTLLKDVLCCTTQSVTIHLEIAIYVYMATHSLVACFCYDNTHGSIAVQLLS